MEETAKLNSQQRKHSVLFFFFFNWGIADPSFVNLVTLLTKRLGLSADCHPSPTHPFFKKLINLFLAALGLHCFSQAFSSCGEHGLLSSCSAQAPHCSGFSCCRVWALGHTGSVAVAHGLSCSAAFEIFLKQESNQCPLYCQAGS